MAVSVAQGFALFEGETASAQDWCEALHVDHAIVSDLIAQGVFQRGRAADGSPRLRLNMVGLLVTQRKAFFSLPKISSRRNIDVQVSVGESLAAIRTYHRHIMRGPEVSRSGEADIFSDGGSILDHFLRLWEWTRDFGLHQDEVVIRNDDYRAIDWRSTISSTLPVHQRKSVIYPEPRGQRYIKALSELGKLQAFVLLSLQRILGTIANIWSDKNDNIWEICKVVVEESNIYFADNLSFQGVLNEYEELCTRDNDKELHELLKAFYYNLYNKSAAPMLYGVSSFHVVWEHMCATLFQGIGEDVSHSKLASQPMYSMEGSYLELEPQRPDILRRLDRGIIIGDAKWYKVDADELPGTPDAIKQFSYQSTISEYEEVLGNFIFLPTLASAAWVHLGKLTMQSGGRIDPRFSNVQLVGLGWQEMVALYAKSGHVASEFCVWLSEIGATG